MAAAPGVAAVTGEERVAAQAAAYAPTTDAGSLYNTTLATGAQAYWKAGYTGKGIDVAVTDTGTAAVRGARGRPAPGPGACGPATPGPATPGRARGWS